MTLEVNVGYPDRFFGFVEVRSRVLERFGGRRSLVVVVLTVDIECTRKWMKLSSEARKFDSSLV